MNCKETMDKISKKMTKSPAWLTSKNAKRSGAKSLQDKRIQQEARLQEARLQEARLQEAGIQEEKVVEENPVIHHAPTPSSTPSSAPSPAPSPTPSPVPISIPISDFGSPRLFMGDNNTSLLSIGKKFKEIGRKNEQLIDEIFSLKDKCVIIGYSFALKCSLTSSVEEANPWSFVSTPYKSIVSKILIEWRYKGEKLRKPEDIFNDNVDYKMKTFEDVVRLNKTLLKVGSKFCDRLADNEDNRSDMRKFLDNMNKLSEAISGIHDSTKDMPDPLKHDKTINNIMNETVVNFHQLALKLSEVSLDISAFHSVGSAK